MSSEFLSPSPQGVLADVKALSLLADRLDDHVHVRMRLIRMELCGAAHNCIYVELSFMWSDRRTRAWDAISRAVTPHNFRDVAATG